VADPRNWILAAPEWSEAATITASSAQTETPVTNLLKYQPTDIWSATSLTPYLELDAGSAQDWNSVWAFFSNARAQDVWRVRAANTQGNLTAAPFYDSGQALRLSSNSMYGSQTSATIGSASLNFTLEARFRATLSAATGWIARKAGTGDIGLLLVGDSIAAITNGGGSPFVLVTPWITSPPLYEWIHAALVVTTSELRLYIDGVLVGATANATTFGGNQIEAGSSVGALTLDGVQLDWLRFWNVVRTDAQILANAHTQLGSEAGLICNYKFDGSNANSGSVGGTMSYTGSPTYIHTENVWASPGLDSYDRKNGFLWVPDGVTSRWLRIDFDFTGHPDGVIRLGNLLVSNAHQFDRNPMYGAEVWGFDDATQSDDLAGGQRVLTPSSPVPRFRLPFKFESATDMAAFFDVVRTRGASRPVAICLDPTNAQGRRHQGIGYGTLSNRVTAVVPYYNTYQSELELRGLI